MRSWMALSLLLLTACARPRAEDQLLIAAAASLAPAFEELEQAFEAQTGADVVFSIGATGSLAEQMRNGAPFDLFASADARRVDELVAEGLLDPTTRSVIALGTLALVTPEGEPISVIHELRGPSFRNVALANPDYAPYGLAAIQAIERAGLAEILAPRLVYADNVRQAGQMVRSGNAQAGLVASATALSVGLPSLELPQELHDPILHLVAVRTGSPNADMAAAFIDFLLSDPAQDILHNHGLLPPP